MTDITRLLASLKRRSAHAKEFGDSITFVKLKDIDALVEALEEAQRYIEELREWNAGLAQESCEREQRIFELESQLKTAENNEIDARCRIAELEESHAQAIQSRDHYKRMSEEGLKRLAESRTVTVKQFDEFQICHYGATEDYAKGYIDCQNNFFKWLTAAGIKWEAE
ncbi:TPA: hypothetical protein MC769_004961 [Klebsiella aerogenes]|nr:hypothetical protein [Klebsiella aerogenes]